MPVLLPTRQQPQSWTHCSSSGGSSTFQALCEWFRRDLTEASTRFISVFRRRVRRSAALCWRTTTQSCCRRIRRRWRRMMMMKLYWAGRRNKVSDAHQPEWKQGEEEEEEEERKGEWRKESRETGRKDWERWSWRLVQALLAPDSRPRRKLRGPKTWSEWAPHPRQGAQPTSLWFQVSTAATCPPSPSKTRTYNYI